MSAEPGAAPAEGSYAAFNCYSGGLSGKRQRREKRTKLVPSNGICESDCRFHSTIKPKVDAGKVQTNKTDWPDLHTGGFKPTAENLRAAYNLFDV